jgi:galactokinase
MAYFRGLDPGVRALRDVSIAQVNAARGKLDEVVFRRCRHVVTENARTTDAAAKLGRRDYEEVGELMLESHDSLRRDYEVSVPELDHLVENAMHVKGVYGARMTGGGFGGCAVALVQPRAVEPLREHLTAKYESAFAKRPAMFTTGATAGVSVLE